MENLGTAGVASITIICYVLAEAIKNTTLDNKWLPIICGVFGGILGGVALYIVPSFPATDIFSAIVVGIASGLSATGANQIYKQLTKE